MSERLIGTVTHYFNVPRVAIVHVVEAFDAALLNPGSRVSGQVDGERRADYRVQHHAQHVLS